ncbi:MAG TPA: SusC/RagA family TonB-linked outer membrane protein [Chitinophagaceae bacterium]|nr:SusC/RagA family TonB-linked outer membrane protein [Chitinophagaceae bacterium]
MRKILTLSILLMLSCILAFAQSRVVTGTVTDDKGTPVEGATIRVKGGKTGTAADANGNYRISVTPGATLVISGVGITTQEFAVGEQSTLNMNVVRSNSTELSAVTIVTAQGIRRRPKELGYSAAQVTNADITVGRSPQLAQSLSGKVSGLAIYNVDNGVDPRVKVILRGYRSLTGSNNALIVVDGIPNTSESTLSLINPNDIESVTILKGGQAATLYGSQGVNGALVITTKRGVKGQKLKVSYSAGLNYDEISFLPDFQTQYGSGSAYATGFGQPGYKTDYLARMKDNYRTFENQQYGDAFDGSLRPIGRQLEDGSIYTLPYSNIEGERRRAFDRGYTLNNQIGFSGGDQGGSYYMSVENNKTAGVVPHDESRRTGVRIAATKESDKFKIGFNGAYVQKAVDATTSDFYYNALNAAGNVPISSLRDWQNNKFANPNAYYSDYVSNNPYFDADNQRQKYQDNNLSGNIEAGYKIFSWLTIYDRLGVISNSRTRKNTTGKFTFTDWAKSKAFVPAPFTNDYNGIDRAANDIPGAVFDAVTNENVINNDIQGLFDKTFGQFTNKLIVGYNVYQRSTKAVSTSSSSIVVPGIFNVSNRQGELGGGESNTRERKFGYYADLTTGWRDIVFLHSSFRYDATSRFYKSDREKSLYAFPYYGFDVSVILTDAFPNLKNNVLSFAKLRAGYNRNGNDNIDLYGLDLVYSNGNGFPFGNTVGITVGDVQPNDGLKPEFVNSYEVGGEFQFWKGRVDFSTSIYNQTSKGQVLTVKIPNSTGFPFTTINVGETKNWGYETDLKVQVIRNRNFNLELNGRFSFNDNKVVKLYPGVSQFSYGAYTYAAPYVVEGSNFPRLLGQSYSRDSATDRVLVNSTTGYPLREPKNALHDFGRTIPKYIAGWGTRMRFKDISFAANFEYRGGNVIFHQLGRDMTFTGSGGWTADRTPHIFPNSSYVDAAGKTVENTNVLVREAEYALWVSNYRLISENFVTPGWFIKLRDVNLSYNIPMNLLKRTKFISAASLAVYGRNLFTIVDKTNLYTDPEFSFTTGNGQGVNNTGQTPPVRQYGVNLNLTF